MGRDFCPVLCAARVFMRVFRMSVYAAHESVRNMHTFKCVAHESMRIVHMFKCAAHQLMRSSRIDSCAAKPPISATYRRVLLSGCSITSKYCVARRRLTAGVDGWLARVVLDPGGWPAIEDRERRPTLPPASRLGRAG